MRIAVNGWFLDQIATGSGQYLAALLEWLPRSGPEHEFHLILPARTDAAPDLPASWHPTRVTTPFDGRSRNLAKLWFEQVAFPAAARRLDADVALVPYWGAPWQQPCPVVVTIHDLIPMLLPLYRGGVLQRAYTSLVGRTARRARAVLTDSEAGRRDVISRLGIPPERVHAVHLAAGPQFRPVTDPEELARIREKYGLPAEPFLLYLGGFDARKNAPRMLAGYARITGGLHLVVGGRLPEDDSPFAPDPRPIAARLGISDRVHFIGWVDEADKPALYSVALASIYLSEYEGFGLPVLEAMGSGCAVLAGGSGGLTGS
jgi:glycosyltransferase involved in cell wall biosynthesis